MTSRPGAPTISEVITAVINDPEIYLIADLVDDSELIGRPRRITPWTVLLLGVLARHFRSLNRAGIELRSELLWRHAVLEAERARERGLDVPAITVPPTVDAWRRARDHWWATDDGLREIARIHLDRATLVAHELGLALPSAGGSWSHPDRSRAVYGDGTLVRPLYSPPPAVRLLGEDGTVRIAYPDPVTGELLDEPARRFDPDSAEHHGHSGPVHGTNYVAWHLRGPGYFQRVILSVTVVPAPGREAETAVAALAPIRHAFGDGIQAVVYDGAMRGSHAEQIMRRYGYLVLCKSPRDAGTTDTPDLLRLPGGKSARAIALGSWEHHPAGRSCRHMIAAVDGRPCEITLDEAGDPTLHAELHRRQVKRPRGRDGRFRFSAGYDVPCTAEPFTVWLSPHAERGDPDAHRAEHFRILTANDPDGARLYSIRSDAEAYHNELKQSLRNQRAGSLGARRGLLDQYAFAMRHNALVVSRFRRGQAADDARTRGSGRQA